MTRFVRIVSVCVVTLTAGCGVPNSHSRPVQVSRLSDFAANHTPSRFIAAWTNQRVSSFATL